MSNMKNGFSTLNRWLGKKNKDKSAAPNGKLSKSSTNLNLSISTTNINDTSQLEYNRITPCPAATSNAPFEQTFRITVLLPKDQLYVSRLGARVPLSKLLELVCENKQLDSTKYEFRNPVEPSQVYSCDLTIGAVGLCEIRLCHKSESYDNFNADEVIKLHRTSLIRDSLSSSEFSSRNSKHTQKTASPYSSNNSLNSMDSTGMNYTRTPVSPPPGMPTIMSPKITAPPRKKRAAPRPPSQMVIPEKTALVITNGEAATEQQSRKTLPDTTMPRKDFSLSTPNLSSSHEPVTDINCNGNANLNRTAEGELPAANGQELENDLDDSQVERKNARNLYVGSVQNLSSLSAESPQKFPEPSPRKRLIQIKKKSAPAPPPRSLSGHFEDSVSIASSAPSTLGTPTSPTVSDTDEAPTSPHAIYATAKSRNSPERSGKIREIPVPVERESTATKKPLQSSTPVVEPPAVGATEAPAKIESPPQPMPKPVPRLTTTTLLNATNGNIDPETPAKPPHVNVNVSKVLLNRTPTPEPRSLSCEPPEIDAHHSAHVTDLTGGLPSEEDDNISKQADSGIGEPVPSPIPDSLPSEISANECKSTFESSSDDDDMVKVYNFKLGKTSVKQTEDEPKTLADFTALTAAEMDSARNTPSTLTEEPTPNVSDTSSWNFSIPISPPPNFADQAKLQEKSDAEKVSDTPITPKIKERPVLNFEALSAENVKKEAITQTDVVDHSSVVKVETTHKHKFDLPQKSDKSALNSPITPMNDIVDELSTLISEKRMDSLIRKADDSPEIEAAKPNTLANFSITTISKQSTKPTDIYCNDVVQVATTPESAPEEEKLYRKRGSNSSNNYLKQQKTVARADSFHTTASQAQSMLKVEDDANGLNSRSSSHLSLTKIEQNGLNLNRRRSSSELSIGESPSLQSLEIIKTILNSRKNSLANSSDGETKSVSPEVVNHIEFRTTPEVSEISNIILKPKSEEALEKSVEKQRINEVPKIYRYSGPPSINLSTWSERPKVQVSIKNEGDYRFGGKVEPKSLNLGNVQENKAETTSMPPSTIQRMGIPEKEYRVPITVKPLKDVTVDNVEWRINANPLAYEQKKGSTTTIALNGHGGPSSYTSKEYQRPTSMAQVSTHTSTLPRSNANRFSTPAAASQALLRSTSITQLETNKPKSVQVAEVSVAPFGQNTLRKTGLKEKILAIEQAQEQKIQPLPSQNGPSRQSGPPNRYSAALTNGNARSHISTMRSTKSLQSVKLELNLARPEQHSSAASRQPAVPPTPPIAPPPMYATKSGSAWSASSSPATTPTSAGDNRSELLDAIRNFKREELNRT